jgi:hypothetical protein
LFSESTADFAPVAKVCIHAFCGRLGFAGLQSFETLGVLAVGVAPWLTEGDRSF